MKRLRAGQVVAVVVLLAVSLIPTRSFALSENLEHSITYYVGGSEVGAMVWNACWGHVDWWWGQLDGNLKRDQYTYCDTGEMTCSWYSWNGSDWVLVASGDCNPDIDRDRPDRPRR